MDLSVNATVTRPQIVSVDFGSFIISDPDEIFRFYFESYAAISTDNVTKVPLMRYISRYFDTVYMENQLWKTIVQDFADVKGNLIRPGYNDQPIDKIVIMNTDIFSHRKEKSVIIRLLEKNWLGKRQRKK